MKSRFAEGGVTGAKNVSTDCEFAVLVSPVKCAGWETAHAARNKRMCRLELQGGFSALVVADADGFFDAADEDFSVADAAGSRG